MRVLHGRRIAVLTLTVAFFTLAGVAVGSVPGSGGEINGCYATKGGALRVIDAAKESCAKGEVPIAWNQTGPSGPPGPPGTSGALPNLDALEGVPCSGVGGKPAHVHLTYGTGIEATVTIVCLTHLLANPGPFTVTATAGSLKLGVLPTLDLPTGWSLSGTVDTQGRLANVGSTTLSDIPWSVSGDLTANGTLSLTLAVTGGTIDPASGAAAVAATASGVITIHASVPILGTYDGTCPVGSVGSPISVPFSTTAPGAAYDQTTGKLALGGR